MYIHIYVCLSIVKFAYLAQEPGTCTPPIRLVRAPPLLSRWPRRRRLSARRNHKNERNPENHPNKKLSYIFVFSQVGTITTITTTTRALCKLKETGDGGSDSGTFVMPGHKNQHTKTGGQLTTGCVYNMYMCIWECMYVCMYVCVCTHARGRSTNTSAIKHIARTHAKNPAQSTSLAGEACGRGWAGNRGCTQRRNNPSVGGCSAKKKTELTNSHIHKSETSDKQPLRSTRIMCTLRQRGRVSGRQAQS